MASTEQAAKHTPGPWFIWKELAMQAEGMAPDEITDELLHANDFDVMAGTPVGRVTRGSIAGCRTIVTLDADDFYDDESDEDAGNEEALANARLIAAAPELMEALVDLQELVALLIANCTDRVDVTNDPRVGAACAAIAKATGSAT